MDIGPLVQKSQLELNEVVGTKESAASVCNSIELTNGPQRKFSVRNQKESSKGIFALHKMAKSR